VDGTAHALTHPLDRPVWQALTGRQAGLGEGGALARRFAPTIGIFAAAADQSAEALAALAALDRGGGLWLVEPDAPPLPPAMAIHRQTAIDQMLLTALAPGSEPADVVALGDADAAEMLALATATAPGPFYSESHRFGGFVGIRRAGRLVAMAGERMKVDGFTEVSGVCTDPAFRGRGLAGGLMRLVIARILARGETAFLHVYADNAGAIALYRALGFVRRATLCSTVLRTDGPG
jgi:predicted GNAT family acetyltransferase